MLSINSKVVPLLRFYQGSSLAARWFCRHLAALELQVSAQFSEDFLDHLVRARGAKQYHQEGKSQAAPPKRSGEEKAPPPKRSRRGSSTTRKDLPTTRPLAGDSSPKTESQNNHPQKKDAKAKLNPCSLMLLFEMQIAMSGLLGECSVCGKRVAVLLC